MADSTFLYLTTRGRVSGQPRRIEIWFVEHAGKHYIAAENRERAHWVRNLCADPQVTFSVGTRSAKECVVPSMPTTARVVDVGAEPALAREVCALMDAKYGWSDGLIVELGIRGRPPSAHGR